MDRKLKIAVMPLDDGACALYRILQPALKLKEHGYAEIKVLRHVSEDDMYDGIVWSDVVFIARPADPRFVQMFKTVKEMGKKVVVDHDDNVFKVNPMSPHYEFHGTEEVLYTFSDGKTKKLWENGKENFDIERNKRNVTAFAECVKLADMLTVTTKELGDAYGSIGTRVEVLPNCIDFSIWRPFPPRGDGVIRIGWHGGYSHYEDFYLLKEVLPNISKKYPHCMVTLLGTVFGGLMKNVRHEFHPWVNVTIQPMKCASLNADIAIIPLVDDEFNRCKSAIKYHEFSALKVPSVVSNVYPYKPVIKDGSGYLVNNKEEWIDALSKLIEDASLREQVGQKAYEETYDKYNADTNAVMWQKAFESLF